MIKIFIPLILILGFNLYASANLDDRIVRINADVGNGKVSSGTGFFWMDNEQILTAYHVVMDSKKIRVYYNGKRYEQVIVKSYSNEVDLAILQVKDLPRDYHKEEYHPTLPAANFNYLEQTLKILAFPLGWSVPHTVYGKATSANLIRSTSITNTQGADIFAGEIEVIPIDMTVFGGMSGAPIISNEQVIGVLSGSLDQGGSIAWGIPIKYAREKLIPVDREPQNIRWPDLLLMKKANWRSLNFQSKKPAQTAKVLFSAFTDKDFEEFNFNTILKLNNFNYNMSYGLELGFFNDTYQTEYSTLAGINKSIDKRTNLNFYFNIFFLKEYFQYGKRPNYGISLGLPINVQFKGGFKLFSIFSPEFKVVYSRQKRDTIEFNPFGNSYEHSEKVNDFKYFIGINLDLYRFKEI